MSGSGSRSGRAVRSPAARHPPSSGAVHSTSVAKENDDAALPHGGRSRVPGDGVRRYAPRSGRRGRTTAPGRRTQFCRCRRGGRGSAFRLAVQDRFAIAANSSRFRTIQKCDEASLRYRKVCNHSVRLALTCDLASSSLPDASVRRR
ncbi:hypothetical protein A33M_0362 [Rhodovulum sp. PH10]|nr:hypothetical protein A33M_0362 [Rhodovulum sp. PH10]